MRAVFVLLAAVAASLLIGHYAGPEDVSGPWYWAHQLLVETGVVNAILGTCLLALGVIVFDRVYLPNLDTWQMVRHSRFGDGHLADTATQRVALGYQRTVLGFFIMALGLILYVSVA